MGRLYRLRQRRGASVVEFAIVAPVFIMLVFGMIEYGRMVMVQQVITNASREGARRAIVDGATTSEIQTLVKDYLQGGAMKTTNLTIVVTPNPPSSAKSGDPVTVRLEMPFKDVSWLPGQWFLGSQQLKAETTMRRESVN